MMGRGRGGGGGGGRGGRDRSQGHYSPRIEERERRSGWGVAPPSRHLWVGNLSPQVTENLLSEQFVRFGDIEDLAYVPGRSFAFVNYMKEEDAVIALRGLQGFNVAGAPLRIEFAKGDRASEDDEYPLFNEGSRSTERRDSRPHRPSPERSYEKSKGSKSSEPSEVLWVGFPASMKVDEVSLRRAFSSFGEIDQITTFPGRSYAFVRYRSVVAACRAKEALQGKLFNNPRVNILFAKSDTTPAEHGRGSMNAPYPSQFRSNFHPGLSGQGVETFQREKSFDSPIGEFHMASPRFPNMDRMHGDTSAFGFGRGGFSRPGAGLGLNTGGTFEHNRLQDLGSERRMPEDMYERYRTGAVESGASWHDPPFERSQRAQLFEDSWGADDESFPTAKKLKTNSYRDQELPEYPFSHLEQERHDKNFPSLSEHHHAYNKNLDTVPFGYKGVSEHLRNLIHSHAESDDSQRAFDGFNPGSGPSPINSLNLQRINPEPRQPPLNEEWKWEGTIAKGGTAVCRARCFPVGKVLDFMLPEFINCTARTGLDMLAKHYYQSENTWVVFFVPETDGDIVFYNEFMHYLGEKQRAAVAKLSEKTTLFLVPPSDFSEQVLKVPGKVSISGVILKFQQPSSNFSSLHHPLESSESKLPPLSRGPYDGVGFHEDTSFRKPNSPDFRPFSQGQNYVSASSGPVLPMEKGEEFHVAHDQLQHQNSSNWSGYMQIPNSSSGSYPPSDPNASSHSFDNSLVEEYLLANARASRGTTSNNYTPETLGASKFFPQQQTKPQPSTSMPIPLQPEQLAQLAALLGKQKQSGSSTDGSNNQSSLLQNPSLHPQTSMPSGSVGPHIIQEQQVQQYSSTVPAAHFSQAQLLQQYSSTVPAAHFSQVQPLQQHPSNLSSAAQISQVQQLQQHPSNNTAVQPVVNHEQQSIQQAPNNTREETEADPQKRLQATLQLAAALLQQIQQQTKTTDQR